MLQPLLFIQVRDIDINISHDVLIGIQLMSLQTQLMRCLAPFTCTHRSRQLRRYQLAKYVSKLIEFSVSEQLQCRFTCCLISPFRRRFLSNQRRSFSKIKLFELASKCELQARLLERETCKVGYMELIETQHALCQQYGKYVEYNLIQSQVSAMQVPIYLRIHCVC